MWQDRKKKERSKKHKKKNYKSNKKKNYKSNKKKKSIKKKKKKANNNLKTLFFHLKDKWQGEKKINIIKWSCMERKIRKKKEKLNRIPSSINRNK